MKRILICIALGMSLSCALYAGSSIHTYNPKYYNVAHSLPSDTAVLIVAYNRPHYFKEVLDSIATNPESQTLPFFFVLDGGPDATQKENIELIEQSSIKHKEIIARPYHYDCGRNIIDARRFMFDWCGFDKVIVFEDDMVVSPQYITLVLNLHAWAKKEYSNVGAVQCSNHCYMDKKTKERHLDLVEDRYDQWWAYCMDKKTHEAIKDLLYEYEEQFLINWQQDILNGPALSEWTRYYMHAYPNKEYERSYPAIKNYIKCFERRIESLKVRPNMRKGQDIETHFALFKAGCVKITTVVNRSRYIGKSGFSFTPEWWNKNKYDDIVLHCFQDDACRTEFRPRVVKPKVAQVTSIDLSVSDAEFVSNGIFASDGVFVSDTQFVSDGVFASDNIFVSDAVFMSDNMFVSDAVFLHDDMFVSDSMFVSDNMFVSDALSVNS